MPEHSFSRGLGTRSIGAIWSYGAGKYICKKVETAIPMNSSAAVMDICN
jgi:hypothetical protein